MKSLLIFALVALLVIPALSLAATPQLVSVHGKLTDTLNNPYSGSKNFAFRIYSAQSGGSALYTEFWNTSSQQVSLAYGGYFSVLLGSQTALALPFDQQYWLEITVESETLSPRYKLGSTPYTYHANITDNLAANANASGNLNMNSQNITGVNYLGIGLSSPSSRLHLNSSGDATLFNATNGTVNSGLFVGTLSGGNAGASIGTNSNHQFRLFTGGTDRLTVNTNGYVGIGTTNPNRLLTVQDSGYNNWFRLGAGSNNSNEFISVFGGNPGAVSGHSYLDSPAIVVPKFLRIFTNASDENGANGVTAMVLDTSGNVGIGTASPVSKLDIAGSLIVRNTSCSPLWALDGLNIDICGGYVRIQAGNSPEAKNIAINQNGGNVGIGTTSPAAKLSVSGNVTIGSGAATANRALCWTSANLIGYCSSQPDVNGACTCNAIS